MKTTTAKKKKKIESDRKRSQKKHPFRNIFFLLSTLGSKTCKVNGVIFSHDG
jgi:hypothetical protein